MESPGVVEGQRGDPAAVTQHLLLEPVKFRRLIWSQRPGDLSINEAASACVLRLRPFAAAVRRSFGRGGQDAGDRLAF
jgi:hypothetical protein